MNSGRSLRKTWLLLILFWPMQHASAAQTPSKPDCRLESYQAPTDNSPQPEAAPDDINLIGTKIARIEALHVKFKIMPSRFMELSEALAGYCETGVPLVASDGSRYYPAGFSDDLGIYYFIPRLALLTHLELSKAVDLFFDVPLIASMIIGIAFLLPILENRPLKFWAVLSVLVLTFLSLRRADVYSFQTVGVLAILPWSISLARKKTIGTRSTIFMAGAGFVIGFTNLIRGQAATGVAIFLIVIVVLHRHWARSQKLALLVALIAGFFIPTIFFHSLLARRDAFLSAVQPDSIRVLGHPIWHSVYIGFSFIPNKYVPGYRDEIVAEMVHSIAPSVRYLSPEYERIVRAEVFRLVREHPLFACATILAKLAGIGCLLLVASNVGLLASALYPKPWPMELAFWSAMGFNSLFGLLVLPHLGYLQGFTALAVLYGIISIEYALTRYRATSAASES